MDLDLKYLSLANKIFWIITINQQTVKAGIINFQYENGFIRKCSIGQSELLRMIYFAIRDENWGNISSTLSEEVIEEHPDSFLIKYKATFHQNSEPIFYWDVSINGYTHNEIHFEIVGEAIKNFQTNRAGFCILHPIENIAGNTVDVTNSLGQKNNYTFPENIAPHQPIMDITEMAWTVENAQCEMLFIGDIFETEDQRNWGDASFKTYCTPLSIPFPREIVRGQKVIQKVILKVTTETPSIVQGVSTARVKNKYKLGISFPNIEENISDAQLENIQSKNLDHLRIELDLTENDWQQKSLAYCHQARRFNLPLEIVLLVGDNFQVEVADFLVYADSNKLPILYLLLLSKNKLVTDQVVVDYIPSIRERIKNVQIGIGSLYNFTEINRNRLFAENADFIAFSFDPQQHATDDLTIMENAETVKYLVASAKEIYQKPVHLSPILLKKRFNPYAKNESAKIVMLENQRDQRYQTDFILRWQKELMKHLAESGVSAVSFLQTHGPQSIEGELGS